MQPEFTAVYDITTTSFPWRELLVPPVLALVFAIAWILWTKYDKPPRRFARILPWLALLFSIAWTAMWAGVGTVNLLRARKATVEGHANVIEGTVHDFVPEPSGGHASEHFSVKGKTFYYASGVLMPGFRQSQRVGGPIRNGLYLRVHYLDDDILKLEIRTRPPGSG